MQRTGDFGSKNTRTLKLRTLKRGHQNVYHAWEAAAVVSDPKCSCTLLMSLLRLGPAYAASFTDFYGTRSTSMYPEAPVLPISPQPGMSMCDIIHVMNRRRWLQSPKVPPKGPL